MVDDMGGDPERVGGFFYDADLAKFGNAFSPFVQTDSQQKATLALQRPFQDRYNPCYDDQWAWSDYMSEFVGADPGPTCWTDPDTGVISMFSTSAAAKRAARAHAVTGFFDVVSDKTGFKKSTVVAALGIGGLTALLMSRNPRHALEIGVAGGVGIALSMAFDLGVRGAT
jgi:hypothetical protein